MAEGKIDKLTLEVDVTAEEASKVFGKLEKNLTSMKKALGGIDTKGMANIQSSLSRIATMTGSLDKLSASIDNLASKMKGVSNIKVAPKVDTSGVSTSTNKMGREVEKIEDKMTRLKSIANAAMGGDASAITSFNRKAASLIGDLDVIEKKFKRLGDTRIPTDSFIQIENQMKSLDDKLKLLQEDYRNVASGKVSMSDDQFIRLKSEISSTRTELDGLADKQREMITNGTAFTDPYGSYRESVVSVRSELEATMNKVNGLKSTTDGVRINPEPTVKPLEIIGQKAFEVSKQLAKLGAGTLIHGIKGLGSAFSKLKDSMSDINSRMNKFHGFMDKGFMRILKYGFGIRSLYVGFRRLRKAVVESFGELQKSGAFFQTTKSNIEGLKTSLTTLKFQFGAAFEPIFNAVAPALQTLVDYLVKAMNVFSAFTAKLMGKDTYSRAVASSGAIAGNVGSAAKSAKELNKQLQGFDELNNLTTNDNSGGGGGGGTGGSGSGVTYVTEQVDNVLGDFGKELAKLIREGKWEEVGAAISEKLTEQLNSIKWENLKAKAANFGKNLGDFINGLITPELFSAIGTTIGESINTALTGTLSLGETIKWDNLGTSVATGIESFVSTNPLKLLAENFDTWANGILDAIIEALDKLKEDGTFDKIGKHIADAINTMNIPEKLWKLGYIAKSILEALADAITSCWEDLELQNKIGLAIVGMVAVAKLTGLGSTLAGAIGVALAGETLSISQKFSLKLLGLTLVVGGLFLSETDLGEGGIKGKLSDLAFDALGATATYAGLRLVGLPIGLSLKIALVKLSWDLGTDIGTYIGEKVSESLWGTDEGGGKNGDLPTYYSEFTWSGFIKEVKLASKQGVLKEAWDNMWDELYAPVFDEGKQIALNIDFSIDDAKKKIRENLSKIKKEFDLWWNGGSYADFGESLGGGAPTIANEMTTFDKGMKAKIEELGKNIWEGIKEGFVRVIDFTNPAKLLFDDVVSCIKLIFGIESPAKEMNIYGQYIYEGIIQGFNNMVNVGSGTFSLSAAIDNLKTKLGEWITKTFTGWNVGDIISKVANLTLDIKSKLDTKVEDMSEDVKTFITNLKNKLKFSIRPSLKNPKSGDFKAVKKKIDDFKKGINKTITMKLDITTQIGNGIKKWINDNVVNPLNKQLGNWASKNKVVYNKINKLAEGGVYSHGRWSSIPQFANGTNDALRHGSVFVAGEKGPEVAGHINGRTEILNKSQLASIMYTSITRGMAQFRNAKFASPDSLGFTGTVVNTLANSIAHNNDSALIEEQNRLLAEQNRLLQQIANKDVTISSREVFKATRREARNFNNKTGNSPFIF